METIHARYVAAHSKLQKVSKLLAFADVTRTFDTLLEAEELQAETWLECRQIDAALLEAIVEARR